MTARRDVIADHFDKLVEAPVFVQKGNLDADNPLIFNNEGMEFNQIKKDEILLKDETKTPWIVGYIDKTNIPTEALEVKPHIPSIEDLGSFGLMMVDEDDPAKGAKFNTVDSLDIRLNAVTRRTSNPSKNSMNRTFVGNIDFNNNEILTTTDQAVGITHKGYVIDGRAEANEVEAVKNFIKSNWSYQLHLRKESLFPAISEFFDSKNLSVVNAAQYQKLIKNRDQIVYSSKTKEYYRMTFTETVTSSDINTISSKNHEALYSLTQSALNGLLAAQSGTRTWSLFKYATTNPEIYINYKVLKKTVSFTKVDMGGEIKLQLGSNPRQTEDSPYNIFCMPYTETNLMVANEMAAKWGVGEASRIYDIQILPFCPARDRIKNGSFSLSGAVEDVDYSYITRDGTSFSYLL